jgi:hypothetical protein
MTEPEIQYLSRELRLRCSQFSQLELLRLLGYRRISPALLDRLRAMLEDTEHLALNRAWYDFRYSGPELLHALCKLVGIPEAECQAAVDAAHRRIAEDLRAFQPYLFVDTGFRRKNEMAVGLAMCEPLRHLRFPRGFWRLPLTQQIARVQSRIREHMAGTGGELPMWGGIRRYCFYYQSEGLPMVFDPSGQLLGEGEPEAKGRAYSSLPNDLLGLD